jgi:nitrate/nitrite-specific signal transduction histidine kinase
MRKKIITSFVLFSIIIISSQIIFHFDIKRQAYDAEIINKAGRQRMYSQQITKMALYANEVKNSSFYYFDLETLRKIIHNFSDANTYLRDINTKHYKQDTLTALFKENEPYFNKIVTSSKGVIEDPDNTALFTAFIVTIKSNENGFLKSMDAIVAEYQKIAEKKINRISNLFLIYNVITLILLAYALFFIMLPLFKKNRRDNFY